MTPANWETVQAYQSQPLVYLANVATQGSAISQQIASVVFTVDWDQAYSNPGGNTGGSGDSGGTGGNTGGSGGNTGGSLDTAPEPPATRSGFLDKDVFNQAVGSVVGNLSFVNEPFDRSMVTAGQSYEDVSELKDMSAVIVHDGDDATVYGENLYAPEDSSYLFQYTCVTGTLDLRGLNTSYVTTMQYFLESASDIQTINLGNMNTYSVRDMSFMFSGCIGLRDIYGLENFETNNLMNLEGMFEYCESITNVDGIQGWDVSNVLHLSYMFSGTTSIQRLDLSNWDVSLAEHFTGMFSMCGATSINLSGWNAASAKQAVGMFDGAVNLQTVDLRALKLSQLSDIHDMFWSVSNQSLSFALNQITVGSQADKDALINGTGTLPKNFDPNNIVVILR